MTYFFGRGDHRKTNVTFESHEDLEDPVTGEAFLGLSRRELHELRTAECDAADIGEDAVGDCKGRYWEEPDDALKDVVQCEICWLT